MCLNAVTRLIEDLLPDYHSINRDSEFSKYFIPDRDHPSYSWNFQMYTPIGHTLEVEMTNDTCVKSSMASRAYKVIITPSHEIPGWKILSRLIHSRAPHLGGINSYV